MLIERLDALGVKVERQTELLRFEQDDGERAGDAPAARTAPKKSARPPISRAATVRIRPSGKRWRIGFPGGTYTGLFYVADVEATGPATDDELHLDLEDADFLVVFPLKGAGRLRLVGTVRDLPGREAGKLTFDDVQRRGDRASEAQRS